MIIEAAGGLLCYCIYSLWSTIFSRSFWRQRAAEDKAAVFPDDRPASINVYGFFHPYCDAGGGGEKVLWRAVHKTLQVSDYNRVIVYTGDSMVGVSPDQRATDMLRNVRYRFDISVDVKRVRFVFLHRRYLVDAKTWPRFTLLGQAVGSVVLAFEALWSFVPDVWCDTMGYPFGFPVVKHTARLPIVAYTHYPVVSTDMLEKLQLEIKSKASLCILLRLKYVYWKLFMKCYQLAGKSIDISITNSTWTNNHVSQIWKTIDSEIIYPPCSTEKIVVEQDGNLTSRKNQVLSIAQFRPEKRHDLIINCFAQYLKERDSTNEPLQIVLVGTTRSQADKDYVEGLKQLAYENLGIPKNLLTIITECPYDEVKKLLRNSTYGINAMWNEHFGIAVVEYVAAGLIPLVHASAGPLLDIVVPWDCENKKRAIENNDRTRTGFFFKCKSDPDFNKDEEKSSQYSSLTDLFLMTDKLSANEKDEISKRGKQSVSDMFSDARFDEKWDSKVLKLLRGRI